MAADVDELRWADVCPHPGCSIQLWLQPCSLTYQHGLNTHDVYEQTDEYDDHSPEFFAWIERIHGAGATDA